MILFPQGLQYIVSLMACFHANIVAIPIPVSDTAQQAQLVDKIMSIAKDAQATWLITNTYHKQYLQANKALHLLAVLDIEALMINEPAAIEERQQSPEDTALLLYTSGSTAQPKGAVISHRSLMSQVQQGALQWAVDQDSCIVSWIPQSHNFGLHFGVLVPLLKGASSIILSPGSFVSKPKDWFYYIDQYRASHIAAPNFAFDYCCSMLDITSVEAFSLTSLKVIISGGEANRKETYDSFTHKFRRIGLEEDIFCPHYGLSEMGAVTTKISGIPLRYLALDISSLAHNKIKYSTQKSSSRTVVSCGEVRPGVRLAIVNPVTAVSCSTEDSGLQEVGKFG